MSDDCDHTNAKIVDQSGGTKEGSFVEHYECQLCGARGTIKGQAGDPPQQWQRTGPVFNT